MSKEKNKPAASDPKTLTLTETPGRTRAQLLAAAALTPALNAATVVDTYQNNIMGGDVDLMALVQSLHESTDRAKAGDLSTLEAMLIGQATALQTIFTSLAKRAHGQEYQRNFEAFLGLALKAQAQSRATISALVDLKYPRQATFVKQANIAQGPQQVNNGVPARIAHAGKTETLQNELLPDASHERTHLDTGATPTAATGNPAVGTLE